MTILHKPNATVGQIVKDLELVVEKKPDILLDYSNDDCEDMFVEGVKLRKDIAIIESTGKKGRAATAADLLAIFRMLNPEVGVVFQYGWELLDFKPLLDGSVIRYNEEEDFCEFTIDMDVRLVTTQQMEAELEEKRDDEWDSSSKVAPVWPNPRMAIHMNSLQWRHNRLCLCYDSEEDNDGITVTSFMKEFPVCAEFMVFFEDKYYTVKIGDKGMFFSFKNSGERYLGFYLGEMVYDPTEMFE